MDQQGVLPRQMLKELMDTRRIANVGVEYLNPASVDMPLSSEAFRLEHTFLPQPGSKVRAHFSAAGATSHDLKNPLEVGIHYLIRIAGSWQLPNGVYAYANPKSTSGRLGLSTRVVADGVDIYDNLPLGWGQRQEDMWVIVCPGAFPVRVGPGLALSQLRLFDGQAFLDRYACDRAIEQHGLFFDEAKNRMTAQQMRRHADSFFLSVKVGEGMGWECRGSREVLDMAKPAGHYKASDFFEPLRPKEGRVILRAGSFYILSTKERVMVPPECSAELREVDNRVFDGRVHSAGFIDAGWGWGKQGDGCGRPITLEVVPMRNTLVQDGQRIGRVRYERNKRSPDIVYESGTPSYAGADGVALAKYFDMSK